MNIRFKFSIGIYIVTALAVLVICTTICYLTNADQIIEHFIDINYFELLEEQVANTLIVLSLTSVLSTNFGQAYWVDIKDTKLVTPFWSCFIGITVYLLTALVFSMGAYAAGIHGGVVISAVFATILLIILTFKMISIYFGKEDLKKQLIVEYKHRLILNNTSYVDDYLRRLKKYLQEVEGKEFAGKGKYIKKLKDEIQTIENQLNSECEPVVDAAHKSHIDKHIKCMEELQDIDLKIEEYTKNAINNNETEVVRENIELLVECENYNTFFNLIEELFEWDAKYACKTLKELSKKNMAWRIKGKTTFFYQYALSKLITQSGKLDAIQNLLMIYDASNLGMSQLEPRIRVVTEKCNALQRRELEISRILNEIEDFRTAMKKERELRKQVLEEDALLQKELLDILQGATAKDLRAFYIPMKETCTAYEEGKYEIVNKYLKVILENFNQDILYIQVSSGILEINARTEFTFSYVTKEEQALIEKLLEMDETKGNISSEDKAVLSKMNSVTISNDYAMQPSDAGRKIRNET